MTQTLVGTTTGLFALDDGGPRPLGLAGRDVTAMFAGNGVILAGTYGDGLYRSGDEGANWSMIEDGLTADAFRAIVPDPHDLGAILAGTEPGRIFRSIDGGLRWTEFDGISALPGVDEWYLPYSPRAGAVRNIYGPPGTSRLLASVEVGGLLASDDHGDTWSIAPVLHDTDIHFVTGHPEQPDTIFAALGWASLKSVQRPADAAPLGGVARSDDGGKTWRKFHSDYTRAVIVPPTRTDLLLAAPAKKVGSQGRIEVSSDGGETWQPAMAGLDSTMPDMVELFVPAPDGSVWAIRSGGGLMRAEPGEWNWQSVLPSDADIKVRSVAFVD